ncbi:MAG: glycosyl hydrolase [Pseudonocardiaceae bacterium]
MTRTAALSAAIAALALAGGACANQTPPGTPTTSSGTLFAPYLYLDAPQGPTLTQVADETGDHSFVLAFILAGPGGCTPSWNATKAVDDPTITTQATQFRAHGGNVIVSSGGANGPYLENACRSPGELAAAYSKALDAVGSNHLDIDVEDDIPVEMVNAALVQLQRDRGTAVTYTLKVENARQGLTTQAMTVLRSAAADQLDVTVNAMLMNFDYTGDWGAAMLAAADTAAHQIGEVWPAYDAAQRYSHLGITLMIGRNDSGMVTTPDDARRLADYAQGNNIGYVGFWLISRDNGGCPGQQQVSDACSGVAQTSYEYTSVFD